MEKGIDISLEEFLDLSSAAIRKIVVQKNKPRVGVFVADGNRRLVMCRTRVDPTSDEFYHEYARFFTSSLKKTLGLFFDHGLQTLFFPLFGPSLVERKNQFQTLTIPAVYKEIFQTSNWLQFYKDKGIRIKAYGDLSQLAKIDALNLDMEAGIRQAVEKTAANSPHTLFFGFMSDNTPGFEMPGQIIDFYNTHRRTPSQEEMLSLYYGQALPPADFLILSSKLSLRALPPLISFQDTRLYFLPTPGFHSLTLDKYKKILHDLLFVQAFNPPALTTEDCLKHIDAIEDFLQKYQDTIIGIEEKMDNLMTAKKNYKI